MSTTSSRSSPGSPGGKAAPTLPVVSLHGHSGSSSSSSSTPSSVRMPSPLNPSRALSQSPRTTPTSSPIPLPDNKKFSARSTPIPSPDQKRISTTPVPASVLSRERSAARQDATSSSLQIIRVQSNPLPDLSVRGFSMSLVRSRSRSPSRALGPMSKEHESADMHEVHSTLLPGVSWWRNRMHSPRPWTEEPKRKKTIPVEQTEGYVHTRQRVIEATGSILGTAARVTHEALFIGVDLLRFAPIPALEIAGQTLLNIWDSLEMVESNRLACLRLTERCAEILLSIREEILDAPRHVAAELRDPIIRLQNAFADVHSFLQNQAHRPFLKRYLKRDEILRSISYCDAALSDALNMFGMSVQIRTLKVIQTNELRRQKDAEYVIESLGLSGLPSLPHEDIFDIPSGSNQEPIKRKSSLTAKVDEHSDPREVQKLLASLRQEQDARDRARDLSDLRQLMRAALQTNNDAAMIEVLQIGRDEMPEAIKTLQRALEREVERDWSQSLDSSGTSVESPPLFRSRGRPRSVTVAVGALQRVSAAAGIPESDSGSDRSGRVAGDTLDREFIEGGIDALRRLSQGKELHVPSWTITRYEVDIEEKIGIGFFSDVYKGRWRKHTVAIKVLAETTPQKLFLHEIGIWRTLEHPNVLELLGASSATGDPPWFLVSPYYANGSLVQYLKGLEPGIPIDMLKMMHEVAKGMVYLHQNDVLHGDLKAANVLVDDQGHCVITDFGQSEMKSEVYRLSRSPLPPTGTLRWQAPELMMGSVNVLTPEIDVYAFAILCVEIMSRGALPWPLADDEAVRRFVLAENKRPSLPLTAFSSISFQNVIQAAWQRDPQLRPSFVKISRSLKILRSEKGSLADSPRPQSMSALLEHEAFARTHDSPDMRPTELPETSETQDDIWVGSSSSDATYETADGDALHISFVDEHGHTRTRNSSIATLATLATDTSLAVSTTDESLDSGDSIAHIAQLQDSMVASGYVSPPDPHSLASQYTNERRYRLLLQHDYHTTLTLPLWTPCNVQLGAVGYLSKPFGGFVTLLNCFSGSAPDGSSTGLPAFLEQEKVSIQSIRLEKRNAAQRGFDLIQGFMFGKRKTENGKITQSVSRTQAFQLRSGHKTAHLYAESTVYRYVEDLSTLKIWFENNIDKILKLYGREHRLTREDVYLIIGTLNAQDHSMFVSHSHPDGQINFNVFSGTSPGDPWGEFLPTTATPALGGPVYDGEALGSIRWACKVSTVRPSSSPDNWDSVLLARLRFKPDVSEPTRL